MAELDVKSLPLSTMKLVNENGTPTRVWYNYFIRNARYSFALFDTTTITEVGSIITGTWNADTIGVTYGGTGQTSYSNGQLLIGNTSATLSKANLTEGNGIDITNGDGSIQIDAESASTTNEGIIQLATTAETVTGTSTSKIPTVSQMGFIPIELKTASTSSSISFNNLSSTYFAYIVIMSNVAPETDNVSLYLRMDTDNGASFDSGASDYKWAFHTVDESGTEAASGDNADSEITILTGAGNSTSENLSGDVWIFNPSASKKTHVKGEGWVIGESTTNIKKFSFAGSRETTTAVDAIQFSFSSDSILSGDFLLCGIKAPQ
ncbi:MAG: hypothetical protein ACFFD1_00090 [Candidatus Thorarchaeota archaeon]